MAEQTVTIPAGTLIHVAGLPFRTIDATAVDGTEQNLTLALAVLASHGDGGGHGGETGSDGGKEA